MDRLIIKEATQDVYELDDIDKNIMRLMIENSKISQSKIARELNINANTLKYREKKLKENNLIQRIIAGWILI